MSQASWPPWSQSHPWLPGGAPTAREGRGSPSGPSRPTTTQFLWQTGETRQEEQPEAQGRQARRKAALQVRGRLRRGRLLLLSEVGPGGQWLVAKC